MQMFNVSYYVKGIRLFQQKNMWKELTSQNESISLHMHKQNPLEQAPNLYFSIINDHLVDISVLATFDEIPALPVQDIKEKPKRSRTEERTL